MKKQTKTKEKSMKNNVDNLVVQCIIQEMGKNPLCFIPIIETVLSKNNPDSRAVVKVIAEGLMKAAISQKDLVKEIKMRILEMIGGITTQQVMNIINEQRLSLSSDSKKFLEDVGKAAMVDCCEKYFNEKKKVIDKILDDYFKTINNYIETELTKASSKYIEKAKEIKKEHEVNITVDESIKDDVLKYVEFLQGTK